MMMWKKLQNIWQVWDSRSDLGQSRDETGKQQVEGQN